MELKHFKLKEFACPCCGQCNMDERLLSKLDEARDIANVPFHINSGYRCEKHNKAVGGSATSSHLKGLAVDIKTHNSKDRYHILEALLTVGFNRLGIGKHFIHADIDRDKIQRVIWDYYEKH